MQLRTNIEAKAIVLHQPARSLKAEVTQKTKQNIIIACLSVFRYFQPRRQLLFNKNKKTSAAIRIIFLRWSRNA